MPAASNTATATTKATGMKREPPSPDRTLQLELDRSVRRHGLLEWRFQRIAIDGGDGRSLLRLALGCLRFRRRGHFREESALGLLIHFQRVTPRNVGRVVLGQDDGDPVLSGQDAVIDL